MPLSLITGIPFWRVGSRRYYAVPKSELDKCRNTEDAPVTKKRRRGSFSPESQMEESIETLVEEVHGISEEIQKFRRLAFRHRFSLSFISAFEEAFACSICKDTPSKTPIIACQACSTLVGCESCTNEWYRNGLDKKCPKCNAPRGLSKTFVLKGFDELITQIRFLKEHENQYDVDDAFADTLPIDADA